MPLLVSKEAKLAEAPVMSAKQFRFFYWQSLKRDLTMRLKGSSLGVFWLVLNPLAQILVYTLVFSQIMKQRLPGNAHPQAFSVFLCAGLLPWLLFSDILQRFSTMWLENANLITKTAVPRLIIPLVQASSALVSFSIVFALFLAYLGLSGQWPGWRVLWAVPAIVLLLAIATGLGVALATLNVFLRDVKQAIDVVLPFVFWLTPIVYASSLLPDYAEAIIQRLNPLMGIFSTLQNAFLGGAVGLSSLSAPAVAALASVGVGLWVWTRLGDQIGDAL